MFVGAAAVRLAYWLLITPHWVPDADADQYVQLSRSLAAGRGFGLIFPQMFHHPTAFRPPLYPFLLTPSSWLFGHALWPGRLLSLVLGSLVVVLVGVVGAKVAGRTAGYVAAAVVALYPPLLANDTVTLTEPLALALVLGAVLLMDSQRWLWAGVLTGLLLLTRPNSFGVLAILAAWCWVRLDLRRAIGLASASVLVFAPWIVRNQIQVGTWHPNTSDGFTLAAVYAKPAQQAGTFVDPAFSPAFDSPEDRLLRFDEAAWNSALTRAGLRGIKGNPAYVGRTVRRNFRGYFEISAELNRYPERNDGRNMKFRDSTRPLYFLITILGLAGLALRWRDPRVRVLVLVAAQFVVLSLVLVAPPRLRAPFDLVCCLGVGIFASDVLDMVRSTARRGSKSSVTSDQHPQPLAT